MYLSQATPGVAVRSTHPTLHPIRTLIPTRRSPHHRSFSIAAFLLFPASSLTPSLSLAPRYTHCSTLSFSHSFTHSLTRCLYHYFASSSLSRAPSIALPLSLFLLHPFSFSYHLLTPPFTLSLVYTLAHSLSSFLLAAFLFRSLFLFLPIFLPLPFYFPLPPSLSLSLCPSSCTNPFRPRVITASGPRTASPARIDNGLAALEMNSNRAEF